MEILFCGSIPKDYNRPHENEDYFNIDVIKQNIRIALSDGATISYDSKNWAKVLADYFVKIGNLSGKDMDRATKIYYSKRFDFGNMTLFQRRGLKYGSYATILGIDYDTVTNHLQILGVGDSMAILLNNDIYVDSFPYTSSEYFSKNPALLGTKKRNSYFFSRTKNHEKFYRVWDLNRFEKPSLLCVTDAFGEWVLKEVEEGNEEIWKEISAIRTMLDFARFIQDKRSRNVMRTDDTTLINIKF